MSNEPVISAMTAEDADDVAVMATELCSDLPYGVLPDVPSCLASIFALSARGGAVFVARVGGAPAGAIGGMTYPFWFNARSVVSQELFWWVRPAYRKLGVGRMLLHALEAAMKERGASILVMGSIRQPRAEALYAAHGYAPSENLYFRPLGG